MKKHLMCGLGLLCAFSGFGAPKDPVLMNVAGKNVTLGEFQYLYNKNNSQQLEPLTIERYLDMFVDYKLKVAEAEAAGLDTTATFRAEYMQYRDELARPYLRDASVADSLVAEAYSHYSDNVRVSHIMLPAVPGSEQRIDSLRSAILSGTAVFEDVARRYSMDQSSAMRGGLMGNVNPGRFPWAFEKAAYDTPVGGISEPVNSGFGWHIIRVDERKPSEGEVHASHILRLTQGKSTEQIEREQALIDSLYAVAAAGADFASLAKQYSEDPGSGRRGGDLGWFGRGMMVQPFDSISFALPDGGLSKPFRTSFGFHVIYKQESRRGQSLDELRPDIEKAMARDDRSGAPGRAYAARKVAEHKGRVDEATLAKIQAALVAADGALDSLLLSPAMAGLTAFEIDGCKTAVSAVAPRVAGVLTSPETASHTMEAVRTAVESALSDAALDIAREQLMEENSDYRNLMNEYRDGILLFEIANSKVWNRAAKDKDGMDAFFAANREKYTWEQPHFKSYVIFAASEEKLAEALEYAATLDAADADAFTAAMSKMFGRTVKVERVLAAKGENPVIDFLAFGGERPEPKSKQWTQYAAFAGRVIDAPENAADVRGAVVADYQAALEAEWVKELRAKYPVKINKKQLKKLK